MYEYLFQPQHYFAKELIHDWDHTFTSDTTFLENTQDVVTEMSEYHRIMDTATKPQQPQPSWTCETVMDVWNSVKNVKEQDFLEKYSYIDWTCLKSLNDSSDFLQILSLIQCLSPIASLLFPFILFFIPFLLMRIQGIPITMETYFSILKEIGKNHFLGKALCCFDNPCTVTGMGYLVMLMVMYGFQMYHNLRALSAFHRNIVQINGHLLLLQEYVKHSILSMKTFLSLHSSSDKPTYSGFLLRTRFHVETLEMMSREIGEITPFSHTFSKFLEFGHLLKCYHRLFSFQDYGDSLHYSFGFEGYVNHLSGLHAHLSTGVISPMTFETTKWPHSSSSSSSSPRTEDQDNDGHGEEEIAEVAEVDKVETPSCSSSLLFKNQKYPPIATSSPSSSSGNDFQIQPNRIITGPNASGKTTFLKTSLINILFSQQVGFGFFEQGSKMIPYTHIHSYLNIPDTSERDSLFQAESRRCKDILDHIKKEKDARHFCIFDELYSGTNPEDAVKTANSFLNYLSKCTNVDFLLTTHYINICNHFQNKDNSKSNIENWYMEAYFLKIEPDEPDGDIGANNHTHKRGKNELMYTYKTKPGISDVHGSLSILRKMDYPTEIIDEIEQ